MSIKVTGLQGVLKNLDKQTDAIKRKVDETLTEGANKIEERAKLLAPVDRNQLRGSIFADTGSFLYKKVVTGSEIYHAGYQEFGTGKKFKDQGRPDIAATFKGKDGKGTWEKFVNNIARWLKDKGYYPANVKSAAQRLNYARFIAGRIYRNGIPPANGGTGYFFRAYDEILPTIIADLQKIVK